MTRTVPFHFTFVIAATLCLAAGDASADTVRRTNGSSIDGKIDPARSTDKEIFLAIGDTGGVHIPRDHIVKQETNQRTGLPPAENGATPVPAAADCSTNHEKNAAAIITLRPLLSSQSPRIVFAQDPLNFSSGT